MQIKINKRSLYAPIRYEATRPFAVSVGKAFINAAKRGEAVRQAFVGRDLLPLLKTASAKIGRENGPGPLQSEMLNIQVFGNYQGCGKVIFDLSKVLTDTLLITDSEDIPCGEVPFPMSSFYLHFGSDSGLFHDGLNIEGAFVTRMDDRMLIDLAPAGFGQPNFLSVQIGETLIGSPILLNEPAKPISQALVDSISDIQAKNRMIFEQVAVVERQLEHQYGQVVRVPSPVQSLAKMGPLLQKSLTLIVNAMFYLAAEPEDVVEDWGSDTPDEALVNLELLRTSGKPGAIRTLENTLHNAGYSKVRYVGRKFGQSIAASQMHEATVSGRSLAVHFRRGHFRRQPYGPERSLRKTIFVAPVLVNADTGGEPLGRIYEMSEAERR